MVLRVVMCCNSKHITRQPLGKLILDCAIEVVFMLPLWDKEGTMRPNKEKLSSLRTLGETDIVFTCSHLAAVVYSSKHFGSYVCKEQLCYTGKKNKIFG